MTLVKSLSPNLSIFRTFPLLPCSSVDTLTSGLVFAGDTAQTCGGYLTMEVYHTGLKPFTPSSLGKSYVVFLSWPYPST